MNYDFLKNETAPRILIVAKQFLGVKEVPGKVHSNIIMSWAKDLGIEKIYTADEIAWCGLFMAIACKRAGVDSGIAPKDSLWALNWNKFGTKSDKPMLGDILTFRRTGGGHVGIYIGEDDACYHVLGGNQSNMVCITRIEKSRLSQARRTPWKVAQPSTVRVVHLTASGAVSENEA